ncbi:hypothetical protein WN943_001024 [Citrus x changshan-huyou]
MLNVMNLDNKVKVALDSDFGLDYKRASSDDDVNVESIQVKVDGATELTIVDEDSEGSEDHERDQSSYLESNLGDNLSNANKEVKRLKLGHIFRDVHLREILHEVMVRKRFAIKTVYSEPRRFVGTCKEDDCPWARAKTRLEILEDHSKGYQKLFDYTIAIHKVDPGVVCKMLCNVVSIPDKSKYGGVLIATIGMDGNNRIVQLAICVHEIESTETWRWFMEHLNSYLDDRR